VANFLEGEALAGISLQHAQDQRGEVRVHLVEPRGRLPLPPPNVLQQSVDIVTLEGILSSGQIVAASWEDKSNYWEGSTYIL